MELAPNKKSDSFKDFNLWEGGYTIIELIIAIGLFLMVITLTTGALLAILRGQSQIIKTASMISNVGLITEQIARGVRTGFLFGSSGTVCRDPSTPDGILCFVNDDNVFITYRFNPSAGTLEIREGNGPFETLTSADVQVISATFALFGHQRGDRYPPRVTIRLILGVRDPNLQGTISILQTTVSSRVIDT